MGKITKLVVDYQSEYEFMEDNQSKHEHGGGDPQSRRFEQEIRRFNKEKKECPKKGSPKMESPKKGSPDKDQSHKKDQSPKKELLSPKTENEMPPNKVMSSNELSPKKEKEMPPNKVTPLTRRCPLTGRCPLAGRC